MIDHSPIGSIKWDWQKEKETARIYLKHDADKSKAEIGENITYIYQIINLGKVTLTNIQLDDYNLGKIELPISVLYPGQSVNISRRIRISTRYPLGYVNNTASAAGFDPNGRYICSTNNSSIIIINPYNGRAIGAETYAAYLGSSIKIEPWVMTEAPIANPTSSEIMITSEIDLDGHGDRDLLIPVYIDISIDSDPSGAYVWLDDVSTSRTTPAVLEIKNPGNHKISIKKNCYKPFDKYLEIKYDMAPIFFKLEPYCEYV
jgi:hypothetical protein